MNVLIVEDDAPYALNIEVMLSDLGHHIIGIAPNYQKALDIIDVHHVDIAIIDIVLSGKRTGLELAEKIRDRMIPIVFMTSQESMEMYKQSQTFPLSQYAIKPFHVYNLDSAIHSLMSMIENNPQFLKDGITGHIIPLKDIVYLEVDGNYTSIHTVNKCFVFKKSLQLLKQQLPETHFVQIHRSYIIQKAFVQEIDLTNHLVFLKGNTPSLPISRRFAGQLRDKM
jgi:DNA-binding LytR/AlgR family response regulator